MVVPTFRRPDRCRRLLDALAVQTVPGDAFEVIVVDDASGDDTEEMLSAVRATLPFRLQVVVQPENSGPAAARNAGWRLATAPVVAFTDDDCVPSSNWLRAGLAAFGANGEVGLVQGPTVPPPEYRAADQPRWYHAQDIRSPSPFFEGCNIFFRRQALEEAGGFDEGLAWWGEDTALGWAVLSRGWGQAWAPGAEVTHDVTVRGWPWWARMGLYERHMVILGARYPEFRRTAFWRPWAFRRGGAFFAAAVLGVVVGLRWRPALAAAGPYLWATRQHPRDPRWHLHWGEVAAVDAARFLGHLAGCLEAHTVVV